MTIEESFYKALASLTRENHVSLAWLTRQALDDFFAKGRKALPAHQQKTGYQQPDPSL